MPTGQVEPGVWERRINAKAEKRNGHLEAKGDFQVRNGKLSNHARALAKFEFRDE
jgi:hypothetical protein